MWQKVTAGIMLAVLCCVLPLEAKTRHRVKSRPTPLSLRDLSAKERVRFSRKLTCELTYYHPNCPIPPRKGGCGTGGKTMTGLDAKVVGVAVDPRIIPLGSTVIFRFRGVTYRRLADDIGGGVHGLHVDVRENISHREAWHRHEYAVTIFILRPDWRGQRQQQIERWLERRPLSHRHKRGHPPRRAGRRVAEAQASIIAK